MTAPGYTMKQERNTLFCAAEKEDFTPVYWLRWQQAICLKYSFPREKEDFSQIGFRCLRIVPPTPLQGVCVILPLHTENDYDFV